MPLNPQLHSLLTDRLGEVHIANEGDSMSSRYEFDVSTGRPVLAIDCWGESYYVDCPFCGDSRHRLSINHRYGVYDPYTDSDNLTLACCFNDDCLKEKGRYQELKELIFGFINRDQRRRIMHSSPGKPPATAATALSPAADPGHVVGLADLPDGHVALAYLRERRFDPQELSSQWRVGYCTQAASGYPQAHGRLVIPIIFNGVQVGWQCRHVGERKWKEEGLPKYYTMPAMRKSLLLYNFDAAKQQPLVVVCEGPSDVWRVGPAGVALLGKPPSQQQLRLLLNEWPTQPIVVLLDGDAAIHANRLVQILKQHVPGRVVGITLPHGRDPGSYARKELWAIIRAQANDQKVALPPISIENEPHERVPVSASDSATLTPQACTSPSGGTDGLALAPGVKATQRTTRT